MDMQVIIKFGMESHADLVSRSNGDDPPFHLGQHLGSGMSLFNVGGADEGHRYGDRSRLIARSTGISGSGRFFRGARSTEIADGFAARKTPARSHHAKTAELPTICVALNRHAERSDDARRSRTRRDGSLRIAGYRNALLNGARKQDKSRARSKHRHAGRYPVPQPVKHPQLANHLRLSGAFAARQHQRVERLAKVGGLPQLDAGASDFFKRPLMLDKRTLNR